MIPELITEDLIDTRNLSYCDDGSDFVSVFLNGEFIGDLEVWTDVENEKREYIIINYEMIYLDTIQ